MEVFVRQGIGWTRQGGGGAESAAAGFACLCRLVYIHPCNVHEAYWTNDSVTALHLSIDPSPNNSRDTAEYRGGGKFRPGTISQGIISPGENFATLEIPKAPSKHVSRKMSLNFRKKFCLSVCICPLRTWMSDVVITPVVRALGSNCTGAGLNPMMQYFSSVQHL